MNVRPLTGQVLVRILPDEYEGLIFHDPTLAERGEKSPPRKAVVLAVGPWRKTKQGFSVLPDIHVGQRVLVSEYVGTKLTRNLGENLRLMRVEDVLAVYEETLA